MSEQENVSSILNVEKKDVDIIKQKMSYVFSKLDVVDNIEKLIKSLCFLKKQREDYIDIALELAQRTMNEYSDYNFNVIWNSNTIDISNIDLNLIITWVKERMSKNEFRVFQEKLYDFDEKFIKDNYPFVFEGHLAKAQLFQKQHDKSCVANGYFYIWNNLWYEKDEDEAIIFIQMFFSNLYQTINNLVYSDKMKKHISYNIEKVQNNNEGRSIYKSFCGLFSKATKLENRMKFNNPCPYLLPIRGGKVINYKTNKIEDNKPEYYFTFEVDVTLEEDENKIKEVEEKYFLELCNYNKHLNDNSDHNKKAKDDCDLLLDILGYSITGEDSEKQFYVIVGESNSGKTTLLRLLLSSLGPNLFANVDKSFYLKTGKPTSKNATTPHLSYIEGKRITACSEFEDTDTFDQSFIKSLTGNDPLYTRDLYAKGKDIYCFSSTSKNFITTNKIPTYDGADTGMISRIIFLVFTAIFKDEPNLQLGEKKKDKEFINKLKGELKNAFFTILVRRAMKYYQNNGIKIPQFVKDLTTKISKDNDPVYDLFNNGLTPKDGNQLRIADMREYVNRHYNVNISQKSFKELCRKAILKFPNKYYGGLIEENYFKDRSILMDYDFVSK